MNLILIITFRTSDSCGLQSIFIPRNNFNTLLAMFTNYLTLKALIIWNIVVLKTFARTIDRSWVKARSFVTSCACCIIAASLTPKYFLRTLETFWSVGIKIFRVQTLALTCLNCFVESILRITFRTHIIVLAIQTSWQSTYLAYFLRILSVCCLTSAFSFTVRS